MSKHLNVSLPAEDGKTAYTLQKLKEAASQYEQLPSFGQCVNIIRTLSTDTNNTKIHDLSAAVLKDLPLTTRTLRIANSIEYNRSGKRISTVSQAIMMLGLGPIREIAYSVMLLEQLPEGAQSEVIRNAAMASITGGGLGRVIAEQLDLEDPERGFISGAFSQLGRLMTSTFLPLETGEVDRLVREEKEKESEASTKIFGIGMGQIGKELGRHLNLPEDVIGYMDPVHISETEKKELEPLLLQITDVCSQVCEIMTKSESSDEIEHRLREIDMKALGLESVDLVKSLRSVIHEMEKFYNLSGATEFWAKAKEFGSKVPTKIEKKSEEEIHIYQETPELLAMRDGVTTAIELLARAEAELDDVLGSLGETLYLGLQARNVVVGIIDVTRKYIDGKAGFGPNLYTLKSAFRIKIHHTSGPPTLGQIVLSNGRDLNISDPKDPKLANHIPDWIKENNPTSFFLLPLLLKKRPLGLIYVDSPKIDWDGKFPKDIQRELRLLKNQAILALRLFGKIPGI